MTFLKKELIESGFDPLEPVEGILVVENFISEQELEQILGHYKHNTRR
jgi:hypothetical protein